VLWRIRSDRLRIEAGADLSPPFHTGGMS